jgi:DNA-binding CsgD family transcriptional regulator
MYLPAIFTKQESLLIDLLPKCQSNCELGNALCISPHTIRKHKENLKKKLNLQHNSQLLCFAIECKLKKEAEERDRKKDDETEGGGGNCLIVRYVYKNLL